MRLRLLTTALTLLTLTCSGCKSNNAPGPDIALPPSPSSLINGTRDRLNPFRFTLATDPATPNYTGPITLKVHVIDAAGQPAEGVELKADVSMAGMDNGAQHLILRDMGNGDYEGELHLEMGGSWDVALTATKDGKTKQQQLSIEVGG